MKKFLSTLTLLIIVTSCASVKRLPQHKDAQTKKFTTDKKMAGLYVYRDEVFGGFDKMRIYVDNKFFTTTQGKTYAYTKLKPGKYKIKGEAENDSEIEIDLKPGKNYFVWQEVKLGVFRGRNNLSLVSEAKGKSGVKACERVATGSQAD